MFCRKKTAIEETKVIPTGCENTSVIFLIERYTSRESHKNQSLFVAFILTVATNSVQTTRYVYATAVINKR